MYSNILVPLDGSDLSEQAVPHAVALAKAYDAILHLVHVFTRRVDSLALVGGLEHDLNTPRMLELSRQLEEESIASAKRYLEETATRLKADGTKTETALVEGSPHEALLEYARQNGIDAVVISTHGRGGIKRMLIGSVTDKIIRSGETPVLVVPG